MKGITLDVFNNTIVLSRTFAKKVKNIDSQEYKELRKVRKANPDFEVTVREQNKKTFVERYPGLNDEYIKDYITKYSTRPNAMEEYERVKLCAKCRSAKFGHVRKWFLETYPEVITIFEETAPERAAKYESEENAKNAKNAENADAVSKAA